MHAVDGVGIDHVRDTGDQRLGAKARVLVGRARHRGCV